MIIPHVPTDRLGPDWPHAGGVTASEALAARQRYGANDIVDAVEHPWWALARDTVRDPMICFFSGIAASSLTRLASDALSGRANTIALTARPR